MVDRFVSWVRPRIQQNAYLRVELSSDSIE